MYYDWFTQKGIGAAAKDYAKRTITDDVKEKYFIDGVRWTMERFWRMLDVHPMEEHARAKKICDKYRLKDFNKLVDELSKNSPKPVEGEG